MKRKHLFLLFSFIGIGIICYKFNAFPNAHKACFAISECRYIDGNHISRWSDKKWITLGDSITKAGGYQKILKDKLGFEIIENVGINGQTMAYQKKNTSTYYLGRDIDFKEYDLVTISIGTNDFRYQKKLGSIEEIGSKSFDDKTFCGAYQLLVEHILQSNPNIDLVLVTPLQRIRDGYDTDFTNEVGCKLIDYVNSVKLIGEKYSLPVLDLYSNSGITEMNIDVYTRDGLHPNEEGYKRISEKMYKFLLEV